MEQGTSSGRRRRRSLAAAASVHSSANREQVLTRRLLSQEEENEDLSDTEYTSSLWAQSASIYAIVGVLMASTMLVIVSVVLWARQQQKSGHPC